MRQNVIFATVLLLIPMMAQAMTLEEFLQKANKQNSFIQSQKLEEQSSQLRASEGRLLTSPNYFALSNFVLDKKESQNSTLEGNQRTISQFQTGVEQQSLLGINHKLYYTLDSQKLEGVSPAFLPNPSVSVSSFNYEFTLPMWRNGFGRSTRGQADALTDQNKSESLAARFRQKQEQATAVSIYWRLKSAQELFALSAELLKSNQEFLKWTKNRFRDRLSENIDLKQAEAAVALREFELDQAQSELIEAQLAFNEMLEVPPTTPPPVLDPLPDVTSWPKQTQTMDILTREDILSLEASLRAQKAQSQIAADNSRPQLDFSGRLATNGLDTNSSASFDKSLSTNNPYYAVGLKLSIPLDRSSVDDVQKSAKIKAASIDAQLARKRFEVRAELEKLERNYTQALKVYNTSRVVERVQLEKYQMESERRRSGRTTTFQLLSFQQEYQVSKQARIRALSNLLQIDAQLKLFTTGSTL